MLCWKKERGSGCLISAMPQALIPAECFDFILVSPNTLLHRQNWIEAIKQGSSTVWLSALITPVMLLSLPCVLPDKWQQEVKSDPKM